MTHLNLKTRNSNSERPARPKTSGPAHFKPWFAIPGMSVAIAVLVFSPTAPGFEGRLAATLTRGGETQSFLYTIATNRLRLERGESNRPYARNILNLDTGELTLLFPHNRSFVRLPSAAMGSATAPGVAVMPAIPGTRRSSAPTVPAAIGPTNLPGMPDLPPMPAPPADLPSSAGPQAGGVSGGAWPTVPGAGAGAMAAMPMMPPMMVERTELAATGGTTNLLGYACQRYEIKQGGELVEIWATDQLLPFQPYLLNQPHRYGPRLIEEQLGELLKAKKLFPLLVVLRFQPPASPEGVINPAPGPEQMRFEVKSIRPEKIENKDGALFQPPADYHELEPLPF